MHTHRRFHADHLHLRVQPRSSAGEADVASWLLEELRTAADYYRYERARLEVIGDGSVGGPGWLEEVAHILSDLPIRLDTVAVRQVSGGSALLWLLGETRRMAQGARVRFPHSLGMASSEGRIAAVFGRRPAAEPNPWLTPDLLPHRYRGRFTIAQRAAGHWLDRVELLHRGLIGGRNEDPFRRAGTQRTGRRAASEVPS